MEKGFFKGCLGCLGCGCLSIIIITVVMGVYTWNFIDNDGRKYLAQGIQKVTEEGCKLAFEPDSAAEIASLTKEIRDDVINKKIGVIDSWNYCYDTLKDNDKLQSQLIFAVLWRNLKGKNKADNNNPAYLDEEGAEAVRAIMYAMSQNKLESKEATKTIAPLIEDKDNTNDQSGYDNKFKQKKVKKNITKEDMQKVVEALKKYVKDNNLETPDEKFTPDSMAKEEVIKFLEGLKKLKK